MGGLSLPKLNAILTFSCLAGLGLSLYAYTVELQLEHNEMYVPMCDIGPHMSCSKAFKSEYGKGLGIFSTDSKLYKPNSLFGLMFYSMLATLAQSNARFIAMVCFMLISISNLLSLYFGYILYFILRDMCVVCIMLYAVNVFNLILVQLKLKAIVAAEEKRNRQAKKAN